MFACVQRLTVKVFYEKYRIWCCDWSRQAAGVVNKSQKEKAAFMWPLSFGYNMTYICQFKLYRNVLETFNEKSINILYWNVGEIGSLKSFVNLDMALYMNYEYSIVTIFFTGLYSR